MRSGILCYIFSRVERTLFLCFVLFRVCALSGILFYIFPCMKCALVFCILFFPGFLFISCCIIPTLLYFKFFPFCLFQTIFDLCSQVLCKIVFYFSACGTRSGIVGFRVIFSACGARSGVLEFCINFSVFGTLSGAVEFCVVFFCLWKALGYFGILCYIFPPV